jgi:hypothetical protein
VRYLRPGMMPPPRPWWRCQVIEPSWLLPGYSTCRRMRWHRPPHHEIAWKVADLKTVIEELAEYTPPNKDVIV